MTLPELKKAKRIGFLGFGISCRSVFGFLKDLQNFEFTVRDRAPSPLPFTPAECYYGSRMLEGINEDILFISPSVRRDAPELKSATERGVILSSDSELFFSLYEGVAYGITGTSGKSTVTALISDMLSASGIPSSPIGNFGPGFLPYLSLPTVSAELSSFQLTYITPKLETAVITNIGEDHLNWHLDADEYRRTKLKILDNAKRSVIDADCKVTTDALKSHTVFAAVSSRMDISSLKSAVDAENYITVSPDRIYLNGEVFFDISRAVRREEYNLKNYALASAAVLGVASVDAISNVASAFSGLAHRCERIARNENIAYVNSSIDTSPERALTTIASVNGAKVPIFCGTGKGLSYKCLAEYTASSCRGAVIMGEVGAALGKEILSISPHFSLVTAECMKDAVRKAEVLLGHEGTVILAPAGASYDKYKSFEERGEDFRLAVLEELK